MALKMGKSAHASFPNHSHTCITNAEEAKVNSLVQKPPSSPCGMIFNCPKCTKVAFIAVLKLLMQAFRTMLRNAH